MAETKIDLTFSTEQTEKILANQARLSEQAGMALHIASAAIDQLLPMHKSIEAQQKEIERNRADILTLNNELGLHHAKIEKLQSRKKK